MSRDFWKNYTEEAKQGTLPSSQLQKSQDKTASVPEGSIAFPRQSPDITWFCFSLLSELTRFLAFLREWRIHGGSRLLKADKDHSNEPSELFIELVKPLGWMQPTSHPTGLFPMQVSNRRSSQRSPRHNCPRKSTPSPAYSTFPSLARRKVTREVTT